MYLRVIVEEIEKDKLWLQVPSDHFVCMGIPLRDRDMIAKGR